MANNAPNRFRMAAFAAIIVLFISSNIIACFHAWKFTHFSDLPIVKTKDASKLTGRQKIATLLFGVSNPRPENYVYPHVPYERIYIAHPIGTECWYIPAAKPRGYTILLFHGYSSSKSSMIERAMALSAMGYNTVLVDFMGSGGSEGNRITIGYAEAEQVAEVYKYFEKRGERIILLGVSMGAAAILKSQKDTQIKPIALVLECPFGSLYETTCARFRQMHIPEIPMAGILVFWGGALNGFWGFGHEPARYATSVRCPTLLLHGIKDKNVSTEETERIFSALPQGSLLKEYASAGHDIWRNSSNEWTTDVRNFLQNQLTNFDH